MAFDGNSWYTLTTEELGWAADLKAALRSAGLPIPQPDLLLAQFAIIGKGNTEKAVKRVKNYQNIIQGEYQYSTETVATTDAPGFMNRTWPGAMCAACEHEGHPVVVHNASAYKPAELKGDSNFRLLVQDWLLIMDGCAADLDWVRKGVVFVQRNQGVGWSNFSLEMEKRLAPIYQESYPLRFRAAHMVDSGAIVSTLISLCKAFISKKLRERIIASSREELYTTFGFQADRMPPIVGGSFEGSYDEWLRSALSRRAETAKLVKIP